MTYITYPKDHWTLKTGYFEEPTLAIWRFKPFHWRVQDPGCQAPFQHSLVAGGMAGASEVGKTGFKKTCKTWYRWSILGQLLVTKM